MQKTKGEWTHTIYYRTWVHGERYDNFFLARVHTGSAAGALAAFGFGLAEK